MSNGKSGGEGVRENCEEVEDGGEREKPIVTFWDFCRNEIAVAKG